MIGYPRLPQPGEFLQFRYVAWRDEGEKRIAELRLRLTHYYNLLNAKHISYSNPAVPFKNPFQEPALEFNDDTNPVEHFPTVRDTFGDPRIARAKVILLSGPAGIGKSVLCRHILREQISFGPRPSVNLYVSLPELVREADTRVGLEPLKLVEWCLRHTDNDRFRLDFMDLLQEVNGWRYNVTWILDTRDSTTGRRHPLSDFAPITFQSLMKWMWCAIIVCRSGETLPDLDDKAVALRVRPWTDDTCDRYLDALQELAPTSRRVRMSSTFVKAFFTRTPALTMTPLLLDLIAFANINGSGNGPPSLVALVQSAYEQILLRDQADDVTETNFGHHVAAAFARVFGGTPLPPCDAVNRTVTEVLAAIHVGSLKDEDAVKRVVFRVLTEAAVVDEVVFFTALGEALVERSETAEMLARQLLHAVPNCIGFASACVVALATANTAARAVLVSTAYSLAAVWFKGLESACATQNSATLLQTLHEQFPSHVTLHVAVSCAHPSRAADVVEYCARHGVHPELWQCMIQLPDHEVRNHLALRRLTTSNYRDIWKAAVLITKRSRYAHIPASTAAWLLEAAKLYSMNVNFVEAWLRALEARQGAVYYIGVVAIEEVQRHSNPTSEFLAAEATPKPRLELHPAYLCMLIDYRATLRVAGLTPVSARGASSVLYYDDASHLHDDDLSSCQRDDFDLD